MMKYAVFLVVIEVLTTSFLVSAIRLILVACPHVKLSILSNVIIIHSKKYGFGYYSLGAITLATRFIRMHIPLVDNVWGNLIKLES